MKAKEAKRPHGIGYSGQQDDFRRFNLTAQLNALVEEWRIAANERDYWKERAIKAEAMAERLFAQCRSLSAIR